MHNSDHQPPANPAQVEWRYSMRSKFLFAFMTVFLATFLGVGVISVKGLPFSSFEGWQASARKEAVASLGLVADLRKEYLLRWLDERLHDTQVVAENPVVRTNLPLLISSLHTTAPVDNAGKSFMLKAVEQQAVQQVSRVLFSVQNAYKQEGVAIYQLIRIIDVISGRVVASTSAAENGSMLLLHDEFMLMVKQTQSSYISNVDDEGLGTDANFNIGFPIFASGGEVVGVVIMEVAIKSALNLYRADSGTNSETTEALLVDEQVRILTPLRFPLANGSLAEVMRHKIASQPAHLAAMGHEGVIAAEDYRGHEVIAAYRHIRISPDWGWGLVVKVDEAELFATINAMTRFSLWIGAIGLIFIALLSLLMTRQLINPLSRITRVAADLASGERFKRIQLDRRDEIGVLANIFNNMVEKLESANQHLARRSAELAAVNKELESFAYSVAHDLRAPLRAIDGFSTALLEDYGEQLEGEAKTYLNYVGEGSREMGRLIDDLLNLSRTTRGEMTYAEVDLSKMVSEVLEQLRSADPDRRVQTDIAQGVVVTGDPRLLRVAMNNLLGNAWKFTSAKREAYISFAARRVDGQFVCVIQDNGAGFDMAYENKLFVPFQRLHRKEEFEGSGIGLVTVQRIIHRHGGTIQAKGAIDKGASFTFTLEAGGKDFG